MLISTIALVDVGGFGAAAVCQPSAVQPFAFSSANSNMFVFGGSVQSSVVGSVPWNIQVVVQVDISVDKCSC